MRDIQRIGAQWLEESVLTLTDHVERITPSKYNEGTRYLPPSVTSMPGPLRYDVNPFMREIVDCFDVDSPVREVHLKKGVQVTYSTVLESGALYFMGHVRTSPMMYMTADKELAHARIENNFIPMLNHSGMAHIVRSSDDGNSRKTGKTKDHIQFEGGGYMVPFGAKNADKMRSFSIHAMLMDEIDAWPDTVGKDGDPVALAAARCSAYWERRKIFSGSTPLLKGSSKIEAAFLRGDQRMYHVLCKDCNAPQVLKWEHKNESGDIKGGFKWDLEDGMLLLESVRYHCLECGAAHYEHDKARLFSPEGGAEWLPTARPVEPGIRSYHLPAMYSPIGMQPWYKCVGDYLKAWDPEERKVRDHGLYQVFYNNILAEPYEVRGSVIRFVSVSGHRRAEYRMGQIPNSHAIKYAESPILLLTCTVDVHKKNLAVKVLGWTRGARCYVIEYLRLEVEGEDADCTELDSPVWGKLREIIEEREYVADDGKKYRVAVTLVDAGYANDTVTKFCADYETGVYPILGRDRTAKNQSIKEFAEFETQSGTTGYRILVDHYKDRLAPVLRREWQPESGTQKAYHYNAPLDMSDAQLKELTKEQRKRKIDASGKEFYIWVRPGNARNEAWDLLVYGHAAVEILAWYICRKQFGLDSIEWAPFWDYLEDSHAFFEL